MDDVKATLIGFLGIAAMVCTTWLLLARTPGESGPLDAAYVIRIVRRAPKRRPR